MGLPVGQWNKKSVLSPVYPLFRDDFFSLPISWFNHQLENSELQILPKPLLNGSQNCWVLNEFPICNWVGSTTQPDFSRFLGFSLAAKLDPRLDRVNGQDVNSIETWKARAFPRIPSWEETWGYGGDEFLYIYLHELVIFMGSM